MFNHIDWSVYNKCVGTFIILIFMLVMHYFFLIKKNQYIFVPYNKYKISDAVYYCAEFSWTKYICISSPLMRENRAINLRSFAVFHVSVPLNVTLIKSISLAKCNIGVVSAIYLNCNLCQSHVLVIFICTKTFWTMLKSALLFSFKRTLCVCVCMCQKCLFVFVWHQMF